MFRPTKPGRSICPITSKRTRLVLERLEDRTLPSLAGVVPVEFNSARGLLSIAGDSAQVSGTSDGMLTVTVDGNADVALAGVRAADLHGIDLSGSGAGDMLMLGALTTAGDLTVRSDGGVTVAGHIGVGGALAVTSAGLLDVETGGSLTAGSIAATVDDFVNVGQLRADGGTIAASSRDYLNAGTLSAAGGAVQVTFSESYIDTATALTSAGTIRIDGGDTGRLFSSGGFDAFGNAASGSAIDLFGKDIFLIGASANVFAGGQIRVGGDYQGANPAMPNAQTVDVSATAQLRADGAGRIIVWSQSSTDFRGSASAAGGGFIEVSSHGQLTYGGQADAGAGGTLLLDPKYLIVSNAPIGVLPRFNFVNPGSGGFFGSQVIPLSTGNVVVTDSAVNHNVGAVYLFNGATGALISALTGSTGNPQGGSADFVGDAPITVLPNGNFVVATPTWNGDRGAVTWGSGATGVSGAVSAANSLIGSNPDDQVGGGSITVGMSSAPTGGVTVLTNSNYVVASTNWNGDEGAVTWANGSAGVVGVVSAANSLVGSSAHDFVGRGPVHGPFATSGITALTNGNYVVSSPNWDGSLGAATWGNGTSGISGTISAANSLIGTTSDDQVGSGTVAALTNGNYVVGSPNWNGFVGAATWGNGALGTDGHISALNSLVGTSASDNVGESVTALTNGNHVVDSSLWNAGAGAVTWGNGSTGITGTVSAANSLIGSNPNDSVGGFDPIEALSNGNYVVVSPNWNGVRGAVTFGNGTTGVSGPVSASNSLVGSNANDTVGGRGRITVLSNDNFVVASPNWNGNIGAVTWASGTIGVTGVVSALNSLVGSTANDYVGGAAGNSSARGGVTALANGNYVVFSPQWNGNRGAATWGNGTLGVVGAVAAANSLVGANANDYVAGSARSDVNAITPLINGNYVVASPDWNGGLGAATWGSGTVGVVGTISAANSLVGANANDSVAGDEGSITALTNGNYVVASPDWNGTLGAATWGNGTLGVVGTVSAANSLVGTLVGDAVAGPSDSPGGAITPLANGNYVVASPKWHGNLGAATWGNGTTGVTGPVSAANSLLGSVAGDDVGGGLDGDVTALPDSNYVVVSPNWSGTRGAATWVDGATGVTLDGQNAVEAQNSVVGTGPVSELGLVKPGTIAGSFAVSFVAENGGQVIVGLTDPASLTFATAQGQTVTVTPAFLTRTLNAGTNVTLQANDDITINSPILVSPTAAAGSLTLDAGRAILLNANITTAGGNLTLIANDTLAAGVVDSQRDAGAAAVIMGSGVALNTGAGTLSVDVKNGTDKTHNGRGASTLLGLTAASATLSAATMLGIGVNGSNPGDGISKGTYTQVNVTGPLNLNGASIQVIHYPTGATVGATFPIVQTTGGVSGTFNGLAEGATVTATDGTPFTISYQGNGGKDVVLTGVAPPGFSYDAGTKTLTIAGSAATNSFTYSQASTVDAAGALYTTYDFTLNGATAAYADTQVAKVVVTATSTAANTAILITNDTYTGSDGKTHETPETISLGSKADAGVGTMQKYANGQPYTFLTLSNFPTSYAYVGRADGTVQLFGTASEQYNGFVSAGNYSYIGGPGMFHLAQGAASVYGYSAGLATDFAYHYAANAGSAYVVSGVAFSYMSCADTVNGVTQPYFNVGVGFQVNTGVAKNPGQDFAYIIDSPGNDAFVGGTAYSYMYIAGTSGAFTEFDAAFGFALVYGQSFVGGTDTAVNNDPNKNILVGFHLE